MRSSKKANMIPADSGRPTPSPTPRPTPRLLLELPEGDEVVPAVDDPVGGEEDDDAELEVEVEIIDEDEGSVLGRVVTILTRSREKVWVELWQSQSVKPKQQKLSVPQGFTPIPPAVAERVLGR